MNLIKNIKLYLATFLSISILSASLISCSSDDLNDDKNLKQNNEFLEKSSNKVDVEKIKEIITPFPVDDVHNSAEAKESMASFVSSISEYYVDGMTYQEFKYSLDPYEGLVNIKPEGDVLLKQGFNYIVGNIAPSEMSGRPIVDAFFSGVSYYEESLPHVLDFNLIAEKEYDLDGMTYQEFKYSLDPYEGLVNIKPEGDVLLKQGFNYIVGNIAPSEMSGRPIVDAFFSGVSYYEESLPHVLDFNLIGEKEYDLIFSDLFGLDQSNIQAFGSDGGCKWYQLGCHAKWLVNTIAEWWNTPAIGDGGMTNGQLLAGVVSMIGSLTGLIILII